MKSMTKGYPLCHSTVFRELDLCKDQRAGSVLRKKQLTAASFVYDGDRRRHYIRLESDTANDDAVTRMMTVMHGKLDLLHGTF